MDFRQAVATFLLSPDEKRRALAKIHLRKYLCEADEAALAAAPPVDRDALIRRSLLDLGCPGYMVGYPILVRAIHVAVEDPGSIKGITSGLYATLGGEFGISGPLAERRIRSVIETGWDRCDPDVAYRYFGGTISVSKSKPTVRQFIVCVADTVRQRSKEVI